MKAVLCPLCNGRGTIFSSQNLGSSSATLYEVPCHGCHGCGWVTVPEDHFPFTPSSDKKEKP